MKQDRFPVTHTDAEWRKILTPEQYEVMRGHGTERPGSCALLYEKRPGAFACAGCGQPLFESATKFESGTGWPSFTRSGRGRDRNERRQQLWNDAHRSPLLALRLASGPCLSGRAAADRLALLHQRGRDNFHPGRCALTSGARGRTRRALELSRVAP